MADQQYKVRIKGKLTKDDGWREDRPNNWDDNQQGVCPDCGGDWLWYEAGYVPGTRKCLGQPIGEDEHGNHRYDVDGGCGSLFSVQQQGEQWYLRRERFY